MIVFVLILIVVDDGLVLPAGTEYEDTLGKS